mmetsp:Transcript_97083/g.274400  ORF Transcript_97083/g.274400 Transcript_97083/m.274400 type:complete len:258 (-) Transcript_97083:9-782(-)
MHCSIASRTIASPRIRQATLRRRGVAMDNDSCSRRCWSGPHGRRLRRRRRDHLQGSLRLLQGRLHGIDARIRRRGRRSQLAPAQMIKRSSGLSCRCLRPAALQKVRQSVSRACLGRTARPWQPGRGPHHRRHRQTARRFLRAERLRLRRVRRRTSPRRQRTSSGCSPHATSARRMHPLTGTAFRSRRTLLCLFSPRSRATLGGRTAETSPTVGATFPWTSSRACWTSERGPPWKRQHEWQHEHLKNNEKSTLAARGP